MPETQIHAITSTTEIPSLVSLAATANVGEQNCRYPPCRLGTNNKLVHSDKSDERVRPACYRISRKQKWTNLERPQANSYSHLTMLKDM